MTQNDQAKLANNPLNQGPKITPQMVKTAATMSCGDCEGQIFEQKLVVKTISAIMSPTAQPVDIPIQVLVCSNCGKIHPMSDPDNIVPAELKSK